MMWRSLGSMCLAWSLVACSVASVDQAPSSIAQNQCSSSADCAGGVCEDDQCRSRNGSLRTLLFEVTPPADGSPSAGVQFLQTVGDLRPAGGALDLELQVVAQVAGKITSVERKCVPTFSNSQGTTLGPTSDRSVPVVVTFTSSSSALGLSSPRMVVQTSLLDAASWGFSLNIPPGKYDIYVEPWRQPDATCPVPPQLLRGYQLMNGGNVGFELKLPEPAQFQLHVDWPLGDGGLNGWLVDMLDPVSGRVISNRVQLALASGAKTDYVASLSYLPVQGDTQAAVGKELIRLSPPTDAVPPIVAPTVLLTRNALGLFDNSSGKLTDFTSLPSSVRVTGQVTALATPKPVAASVTLVAKTLAGVDPGVLASFVRTVDVGSDGQFVVDLLPGTYQVAAVPTSELNAEPKLASASQVWEVPANPAVQAGKVIELRQPLSVTGQAVDASGTTAMSTALVQAAPSASSIRVDVLHESLGESSYVPRSSSTSVARSGDFALNTDVGKYDLTVRPIADTGFGWLVLPGVSIGTSAGTSAGLNLNRLLVPLAVSYRGTVTMPVDRGSLAVPGALIRAYAYVLTGHVTDDPSQADSVVQVGETRADSKGTFEILIPATLNETFAAQ